MYMCVCVCRYIKKIYICALFDDDDDDDDDVDGETVVRGG